VNAEELLKQGELTGALEALQNDVRSNPADSKLRVFLFQLLAVMGQWDRALNQLNVAGDLDSQTLPMVQAYRETLRCEVLRAHIFGGERQPLVFGDPERWIALALQSQRLVAEEKFDQASEIREQAYEDAPMISGSVNGEPFEWIADADTRIGPFLEAIVNGGLYWVPFHRIAKVTLSPPVDLRDMVWSAANFTWANGGEAVGFIPTRYPISATESDPASLLARTTLWTEVAADTFIGSGQRVLATDAGEYSVLEIETLQLNVEDPDAAAGSDLSEA
jgi:type VI secretion system protein ImpE